MSRRRLEPPEEPDPPEDEELDPLDDDEEVEYFVDPPEDDSVRISVPKEVHSSQTSISAPSTFTVVGDATSVPHISH
jgi:hypothetical protein